MRKKTGAQCHVAFYQRSQNRDFALPTPCSMCSPCVFREERKLDGWSELWGLRCCSTSVYGLKWSAHVGTCVLKIMGPRDKYVGPLNLVAKTTWSASGGREGVRRRWCGMPTECLHIKQLVSNTWPGLPGILKPPCVGSFSAARRTMKMKRSCTWAMQLCHFIQLL